MDFLEQLTELVSTLKTHIERQTVLTELQIKQVTRALVSDNAVSGTFSLVVGGNIMAEVSSIVLHVGGDAVYLEVTPKKGDGSTDPTVENVHGTISGSETGDQFAKVEPYGDGSNPLRFKLTGLSADADDAPHTGTFVVSFDSNTDDGDQPVSISLPFTVLPANAITGTFETIDPPSA